MAKTYKDQTIPLFDFSGGVRLSHEDPTTIRKTQVQGALNAFLSRNGAKRRPGSDVGSVSFDADIKGAHLYTSLAGTERKYVMSDGKVYLINGANSAKTEKLDIGGTGEFYAVDYMDKGWGCNGTDVFMMENDGSVYKSGITPPAGVTAVAAAGGSIPLGVYTVYACYARKISGSNKIFSVGQTIGNVTLSGGNQTIDIASFSNSGDAQVSNKTIFMKKSDEASTYLWHETNNNTTTSFSITSATPINTTTLYGTSCVPSARPPAFEYIFAFKNRIWGSISNLVYYSLPTSSTEEAYQLERFPAIQANRYPHQCKGFFSVGKHLYINTPKGIMIQPEGDPAQAFNKLTELYFWDIRTVAEYNNLVIGLTNDGIRAFDGEKFLDYDISYDIRPEITKIYTTSSGWKPCGIIKRRTGRREYHLCYNDDTLSTASNNARMVLNLNFLEYLPKKEVLAPWEPWSNGANYLIKDKADTLTAFQAHASAPKIYTENPNTSIDDGIYLRDGTLGNLEAFIYWFVQTRDVMLGLHLFVRWHTYRAMVKQAAPVSVTVAIRDTFGLTGSRSIAKGPGATLWDAFDWDMANWDTETIGPRKGHFKDTIKGHIVNLKLEQTTNDPELHLLQLEIEGTPRESRFI